MTASLEQLSALGEVYRDPLTAIDWETADPTLPWLPPRLLALSGHALQEAMDAEALVRFSRIEFSRLCAAGLWLEGLFVSRLTASSNSGRSATETRVLLQEVREEAGHGLMFLEMIERAGLDGVQLLGDTRLLTWVAHRLDPGSAAFWAMVYVGESITDCFAVQALKANDRKICPLARQVLAFHHKDEARHIAAAKVLLREKLRASSRLQRAEIRAALRLLVPRFLKATLYPTSASLAAAGFARPRELASAAASSPQRRELAAACAAPALKVIGEELDRPSARPLSSRTQKSRPKQPVFIGSDVYRRAAYGNNHPLAIPRVETVTDLCGLLGWMPKSDVCISPRATEDQLARFHDRCYLAALQRVDAMGRSDRGTRDSFALGTLENPVFSGMYERAATSVGGSIRAAEIALESRIAYHPAGGTHHGRPDRASGFCYLNDPVFAILTLLDAGLERILYVDLDAHFGDGVYDAFVEDSRVFTLSLHEAKRWPFRGGMEEQANGSALNIPVPKELNDSELAYLMAELILPLGESFAPEAVVITCGADGLAGDPLSGMKLSNLALWAAVKDLIELSPRNVVLGGGGYNPWTVSRCWTGLWGTLRGDETRIPLPQGAQDLMRALDSDLIDEDEILESWFTQLADEPNHGPVRMEITRLVATAAAMRA